MPMSSKGHEVMSKFVSRYGAKKGKSVAYAKANKMGKNSKLYQIMHGK
jgi:hypothetical protein